MIDSLKRGVADFREAIVKRNVWLALAIEDIGDQHKRTYLGPIWLLVNYLAFAGALIIIFRPGSTVPNFASYMAVGLFVWFYLTEVISLSVSLFAREESFIKGTTLPISTYVLRHTAQSVIRAGYAACGCIVIVLLTGSPTGVIWFWSLLAILLIIAATPAVVIVLAVGGAYFPDLQFVVSNIMRIGLFLTPIFWAGTGSSGFRNVIYQWNPFTYFLEIVRAPIYLGTIPYQAYAVCLPICAVLWVLALILLGHARRRIAFVL